MRHGVAVPVDQQDSRVACCATEEGWISNTGGFPIVQQRRVNRQCKGEAATAIQGWITGTSWLIAHQGACGEVVGCDQVH